MLAAGQDTIGNDNIPKPFVNIYDKPVLMYTLEVFEKNPQVDAILLVCLKGWSEIARAFAKQYNISKLKWVVDGGQSIQETIYNGLRALENELEENDTVIIHDGIRPLVEDSVLTDVIKVAEEKGNAVSSMPNNEQVFVVRDSDSNTSNRFIPRETIRRVTTPQAYNFHEVLHAYEYAFNNNIGIQGASYADTLFADLGKRLFFATGSDKNIKLNTEEEIGIFEAYLKSDKELWLK
ncbi:MAG: 2-C-methyl-D-erythritol 4-phosphate cytidylyltransferase [Sphaerochaetaceae bacterium]|nr:2-C-methyl-D-erythritol 4-phosphate cytidylyltransferase [Sphaerochaetaceae bacterium]